MAENAVEVATLASRQPPIPPLQPAVAEVLVEPLQQMRLDQIPRLVHRGAPYSFGVSDVLTQVSPMC